MSPARILDGKATAALVRESVRERVRACQALGHVPGLAVVLVGEDPASQVYVRNKDKAAQEAGFRVVTVRLPHDITQAALEARVQGLGADEGIDGILVQLPLPRGLDAARVVRCIPPSKDVDGLTNENVAALVLGQPGLFPCTPLGCLELLDRHQIELVGAHVVVLGRSMLVGKPFALLALERHATVTVAHSRSKDLPQLCRSADILVAAVGKPELVKADWLRPGAVVLDVGINRLSDGRLVGDVDTAGCAQRASAITPVPGGVGPMTIAMLLSNTVLAAERRRGSLVHGA